MIIDTGPVTFNLGQLFIIDMSNSLKVKFMYLLNFKH